MHMLSVEGEAGKLAVQLSLCPRLNNFVVVYLMMALTSDRDCPWTFPFFQLNVLSTVHFFYRGFMGFFWFDIRLCLFL